MNTAVGGASSLQRDARIAGACYLVVIAVGAFGQALVRNRVSVPGDATTTAANLLASEQLWRASLSAEVAYLVLAVVINVLMYRLLKPVQPTIALLGFALNLVSIPVEVAGRLMLLMPVILLKSTAAAAAFEPAQTAALATAFIRLHDYAFGLSLVFFGAVCLAWGYLIRRCGYLPGWIGALLQLGGLGYLLNSFALLLSPALAAALFPAALLPALVAEVCLAVALLFRRIDVPDGGPQVHDPIERTHL